MFARKLAIYSTSYPYLSLKPTASNCNVVLQHSKVLINNIGAHTHFYKVFYMLYHANYYQMRLEDNEYELMLS